MACPTGKIRHRNRSMARKAQAVESERDRTLATYFCKSCKGWHLGNTPATWTINLNRRIDAALAADHTKRRQAKMTVDDAEESS